MKEYRTAVIGAGFIGAAHVEAIRRLGNVQIAALCDAYDVNKKAESMNIKTAYSDYKAMMDELELDTVHICTPNNTHYEIAKYAIEKGINFICEKPFTTTIEDARELVSLAKEKNVKGAINFHNRLYPIPNEMHQIISGNELGDIYSVHGGYIQDWLLYDTDYSWRLNRDQVGKTRAIADIGSHWMDLAEFVTGQKITRVNALFKTVHPVRKRLLPGAKGKDLYENIKVETEDEAALMLQFENGAIGSAIISMVYAGKKNTTMLSIAGSKKSIAWDSEDLNNLFIGYREKANENLTKDVNLMHKKTAQLASYPSGHVEGFPDAFKNCFRQFYKSLETPGEYDYATLEDGLHEMILCEAVYKSAMSGQWINAADL